MFAFIPKLSFTQGSTLGFHSGDFQTCNYSLVRSHSLLEDLFTVQRGWGMESGSLRQLNIMNKYTSAVTAAFLSTGALGIKGHVFVLQLWHSGKFACKPSNNNPWYWLLLGSSPEMMSYICAVGTYMFLRDLVQVNTALYFGHTECLIRRWEKMWLPMSQLSNTTGRGSNHTHRAEHWAVGNLLCNHRRAQRVPKPFTSVLSC